MLEIGIIGAGIMGSNHGRVLGQLPDVRVSAVVDADPARAALLAGAHGAVAATSVSNVIDLIDAAVVACPNRFHAAAAIELLNRGKPVLVEKPVAGSLEDADAIIDAAHRAGVPAMVGHIERFNPAVMEMMSIASSIQHLEIDRIGAFTPRIDSGVIADLMIHDLDLCWLLLGEEPCEIKAVAQNPRSATEDLAVVLLRFPSSATATLTASRIGQNKVRQINATMADFSVHADLIRNDVAIHRIEHVEYSTEGGARYRQSGLVEIPYLQHRGEPLALELSHFLDCVRSGKAPRVTLEDGRRALALALQIELLIQPDLIMKGSSE